MTNKLTNLEWPGQQLYSLPNVMAIASLFVGIVAISFAGIFIRLSEYSLSPNATTIMLWVGAIAVLVILPILLFTEDRLFPYTLNCLRENQ